MLDKFGKFIESKEGKLFEIALDVSIIILLAISLATKM